MDDPTLAPEPFFSDEYVAVLERTATEEARKNLAGADIVVPHLDGCNRGEDCYLWRGVDNPFELTIRGAGHSAIVPGCQCHRVNSCFTSRKTGIVVLAKHLGRRVYFEGEPTPFLSDVVNEHEWRAACEAVRPFAHWGCNGSKSAWLLRDICHVYREVHGKKRCSVCGQRMPRHFQDDGSHTYLIFDGEFLKVGQSKNPRRRVEAIKTGNPRNVRLLAELCGGFREAELHREFRELRVAGEWFKYRPDILRKFGLAPPPAPRLPLFEAVA